jgi:Transcription termination factor nusG/KOW motif
MPTQQQNVQNRAFDEPTILQAAGTARWHVLHTLSRQEKSLCEDLDARGICYYLPLTERIHFYGRRKVVCDFPVFAGYVFLLGTIQQAYSADRTGRVARIIPVFDQDRLNWELRNLQIALDRRATLDLYPNLRSGARVEVRSGPFRGLQGVVEDRADRKNRLILQVATLGKSVSLEIDGSLLDRLD